MTRPANIGPKLTALADFLATHGDFLPSVTATVAPAGEITMQAWDAEDPTALADWAAALGAQVATADPVMTTTYAQNHAYRSHSFHATLPGTAVAVHMFGHERVSLDEFHAFQAEQANRLDRAAGRAVNSNRDREPFGSLPDRMPARITTPLGTPQPFRMIAADVSPDAA